MKPRFHLTPGLFLSLVFASWVVAAFNGAVWAQAPRVVMASPVGLLTAKAPAPAEARLLLQLKAAGGRGAIRAAQDRVLARLAGAGVRLLWRGENAPLLAIGAGLGALPALMEMGDLIEEIREEPALAPAEEERTAAVKTLPR